MTQTQPQTQRHIMLSLFGAAVVQGLGRFVLQRTMEGLPENTSAPAWLGALLAISLFVPLAAQLMHEHLRLRRTWLALGVMSLLLGVFGWQQFLGIESRYALSTVFYTAIVLYLWWSLAMPFVQSWLQEGQWWPPYCSLFIIAWRNHLLLIQAALFCGLFWGLLSLAVVLFGFIGFDLPQRLFFSSAFISFATPLAFAAGLYLSAHSPQRTAALLEMVITPLKWLALLAGAILLAFTPLLMLKLPGMLDSGERVISAYALLALAAASVVFINAAFRDGQSDSGFPRPVALALRAVMPLMLIISLVALYAMYLRIDAHGLTVVRIWGLLAASTAVLYGIGYTIAAVRPGPWMADIAPGNTAIAIFVIIALGLMYTPMLSPQRLTADSQFERVLRMPAEELQRPQSPLFVLSHSTGRYGTQKLQQLADLEDHPNAEHIRQLAADLLAGKPLDKAAPAHALAPLEHLPIHPAGQTLTPTDLEQIRQDLLNGPRLPLANRRLDGGVFIDLDTDGEPEFVLLHDAGALLYEHTDTGWQFVADLYPSDSLASPQAIADALKRGEVYLRRPQWFGLEVAGVSLTPVFSGDVRASQATVPVPVPVPVDDPADHHESTDSPR